MRSCLAHAHPHDALLSGHLLHLHNDMMLRNQISVVVVAAVDVVGVVDGYGGDDDDGDDDDDGMTMMMMMIVLVMEIGN